MKVNPHCRHCEKEIRFHILTTVADKCRSIAGIPYRTIWLGEKEDQETHNLRVELAKLEG